MAKNYKVKDLNKNGKIDGWEQGKYDAINSATKMGKGYAMKMGSKQINSATNFKTKDAILMSKSPMRMIGGNIPDVESYERVKNDPLAQESMDQMTNNFHDMYQAAGSSYTNINIGNKSSSSSDSNAYAALGGGLKKLITPKPGSQAEANQKYRQEKREAKRKAQGGTKVGNKLRKVFGTGKENKNL